MEAGRLMPLARVRMDGEDDNLTLGGSLILDLPKIGWIQGGYDSFYGAAAGVGFNLNQRISLGYTMEKGLTNNFDNFGLTHEISFAYSFTPNLTEDRVMLEDDNFDDLVENNIEPENIATNEEIEELKRKLAENDAIIEELMFRQDSLESNRQADLERRFNMVMRMIRNETDGQRPDLEKRAEEIFKGDDSDMKLASARNTENERVQDNPNTNQNNIQKDALVTNTKPSRNINETNVPESSPKESITVAPDAISNNVASAENNAEKSIIKEDAKRDVLAYNPPKRNSVKQEQEKPVVQDRVKSRKFNDLPNVTDGYYVVANVYKGGQYLDKFLNTLESRGINANYIDNPNNGLKYVYLERYDSWEEAVAAHDTNFNGAYEGNTWIMNVENRYSNEAYVNNVNKLREKSSKYDTDVLQKNVVEQDKVASNNTEPKNYEIDGIGSGYYIIANVFANPKNANRFVALLNSYGLSASYFINP
ncbi:type IX secretion system membrane protein PorP/SprF [Maribacter litopenaei]|uniref:type IX secretion system membrane protein PorP/SprF n=1 Tax=Maribacter litopenaei TaxID=2976127 RepID=UPI003083F528